jgi:acyl carrier protein
MTAIEQAIRAYIVDSFLAPDDDASFSSDDDLLAILDSLQILRMLLDLEEQYSIRVENSELTPENLGTVRSLAAFIAHKQQAAVC